MTHPDDEISICAWIRRLTLAGAPVFLSWTHHHPVREEEARIVARKLGVPDENLFFHGAPDGSVCDYLMELLPRFQTMMEEVKPDRVCCGAFEQGHIDHDATNWLVNHSFSGRVLEIPFYHPYSRRIQTMNRFATDEPNETLRLDRQESALKISVAKSYRSQNIWSVLWWYEVYQAVRLNPVELRKRETMRWQTHRRFDVPNLPLPLLNEVERSAQWRRWLGAIEKTNMPR